MDSLIRVSAISNRVKAGDAAETVDNILTAIKKVSPLHPDIIVLPSLALTGTTCGSLFLSRQLLNEANHSLELLLRESEKMSGYLILGLPIREEGDLLCATAVMSRGELVTLLPSADVPTSIFQNTSLPQQHEPLPLFQVGDTPFAVVSCDWHNLVAYTVQAVEGGAKLVVASTYGTAMAGELIELRRTAESLSKTLGIGIVITCGGVGEACIPYFSRSFCGIYECGQELDFKLSVDEQRISSADLDEEILLSCINSRRGEHGEVLCSVETSRRTKILRSVEKSPWLPKDNHNCYFDELFGLQVSALAGRIENVGIDRLVIEVTGDAGSTLALLVCIQALSLLGIEPSNIIGVSSQEIAVSTSSYHNSIALMEGFGIEVRDNESFFDIAKREGGLTVGTADLISIALGHDNQYASVNINASLTNTIVCSILEKLVLQVSFIEHRDIIREILDTQAPYPYLLLEFFLFYFVKYNMKPSKIYEYACKAFRDEYEPAFIEETLNTFLDKFLAAQSKRVRVTEHLNLTGITLSPDIFSLPLDLSPAFFRREVETWEQ